MIIRIQILSAFLLLAFFVSLKADFTVIKQSGIKKVIKTTKIGDTEYVAFESVAESFAPIGSVITATEIRSEKFRLKCSPGSFFILYESGDERKVAQMTLPAIMIGGKPSVNAHTFFNALVSFKDFNINYQDNILTLSPSLTETADKVDNTDKGLKADIKSNNISTEKKDIKVKENIKPLNVNANEDKSANQEITKTIQKGVKADIENDAYSNRESFIKAFKTSSEKFRTSDKILDSSKKQLPQTLKTNDNKKQADKKYSIPKDLVKPKLK